MTPSQKIRAEKHWSMLAGDVVTCEQISDVIYGFSSELGCLRLHYKMKIGRVEYSETYKSWFYVNK